MEYRDDWYKSKERFKAFLNCELTDRCCASIIAPKKGKTNQMDPFPENREDRIHYWTDGEWITKRYRKYFENTYFGGEAFPHIFLNLGAAGLAGFFKNVEHQFEDTVWYFPFIKDWDEDRLEFDQDSFFYKKVVELAKYFVDDSKGAYFVSLPDISGNADALAHMRGSENLLIDMMVNKERVHNALDIIQDVWVKVIDEIYDIIKKNNDGGSTIGWLHTWGEGLHSQMQCDLSVMISPGLFDEFILPELEAQSQHMDSCVYHFDGFEQIRHLDSLLSLKKMQVIQWNNVVGQPSPLKFIPILKRIQAAGKSLLVSAEPEEVIPLMTELSSKGLYLVVSPDSEEEGREILKTVEKLTHE